MKAMRLIVAVAVLVTGAGVLASCGSESPSVDSHQDGNSTARAVEITGAWSRTSPAMSTVGVVYLELTSEEDDELLGVSIAPAVAAQAQIHETMIGSGEASTSDSSTHNMDPDADPDVGQPMSMQQLQFVGLPAGETVVFAPGGYHIMLMELIAPLEHGDSFQITLSFAVAADQTVVVEVADTAP